MENNVENFVNDTVEEITTEIYAKSNLGDAQNLADGEETVVNFTQLEESSGITLANNIFTVSEEGFYLIGYNLYFYTVTTGDRAFGQIEISNNGDYGNKTFKTTDTQYLKSDAYINSAHLVHLAKNATVKFKAYSSVDTTIRGDKSTGEAGTYVIMKKV